MAKAVRFPEANHALHAPAGDNKTRTLHCYRCEHDGHLVSCWALSEEEVKEIAETGVVWLLVAGTHPPLLVSGVKPMRENCDDDPDG